MKKVFNFVLSLSLVLIPLTSFAGNGGVLEGGNYSKSGYHGNENGPYTNYYTYIKKHRPGYYRNSQGEWGMFNWSSIAMPEWSFLFRNQLGYHSTSAYPMRTNSPRNYHTSYRN